MRNFIKIVIIFTLSFAKYSYGFDVNQIAYRDAGKGMPIVLIHAFPTDKDLYLSQENVLTQHYRVITLDLWGFGESAKTSGQLVSMQDYAEEVSQLLKKLHIAKAVIGGESMGGYISLAFLRAHPEKVSALILSDTQSIPDDAGSKEGREKLAKEVLLDNGAALKALFMEKALSPNAGPATRTFLQNIVDSQSATGMASALRGMSARPDTSSVLATATIPILIITGTSDEVIPPIQSENMHKLAKNSSLVHIPNAGHLSNLERPDLWNQAVENFLQTIKT